MSVKRWAKILLAVAVLFVLAIVSIRIFVHANTFRPAIEKQLSATLGRNVKLGDLTLSVLSGSLVAKDLIVADDPNFSAEPFLTAKEFRIGVSLKPLILAHELNLRRFQIESPQINLIRATNGTWNFSSMGRVAMSKARAAGDAASGTSKVAAPELPDLSVERILIEDAHLVVASLPAQGAPTVYEHVDVTARDFSLSSKFTLQLNASLPTDGSIKVSGQVGPINREDAAKSSADVQISVKRLDPVAAGFLDPNAGLSLLADLDIHAVSDGETLTASGTMQMQNLKLRKGGTATSHPLDFAYRGTQSLEGSGGQIEDVAIQVGNAEIHANGTYQFATLGTEGPLLKLKLVGQGLPIDELQPLMRAAAVRLPNGSTLRGGTLSMNLVVTGRPESLVFSGPIGLDNTRLVGFDIGSKVHGIAALGGIKTGDTTDFEKLRATVHVANSGVVASNIDAVIPAMGELTGSGTVSPADELDFNLMVKVTSAKGMGKVGVGIVTTLNGSGGSVPVRVTGTSEDPNITADVGNIFTKKTKSITSIFGKKN
jgi:AsmA protein